MLRSRSRREGLLAALSVGLVVGGVALSALGDGGGGPNPGARQWDCSNTNCGSAGNGACANGEFRCCCPNGDGTHTASCKPDADCGGQDNCDLCM